LNRAATIDHCVERLEASGNLENLRRLRDPGRGDYHGYWFADSDIYKVLEAIGWETGRAGDAGWSAFVDDTVALLREAQEDDGYLALASSMVERRGHRLLGPGHFGSTYLQDHLPVREATEPVGHAVRQLYLAAGVTDVYLETGDASLLQAMERLWERLIAEK